MAANKELDLFAFMASHDLQAPLRKILVFSDRIKDEYAEKLGADGNMYLTRIQKVCNQMKQLINNILEFSKISVKKELFTEVDLNNLIPDILQELNDTIQEKNIHVILGKILPVYCVNAVLMHQLFLNLIGNAVKYTSKTHPFCNTYLFGRI